MRGRALVVLLGLLAAAEGAVLGLWWFRDPERAREASAVLRGQRVAGRMGCFACHGPEGVAGLPNPGARTGEVPGWVGGTYMMYNQAPGEIREWILDGAPRRLLDDPSARASRAAQLLAMPAYRGRVAGGDLDDLVAYVQSVSGAFHPPEGGPAAQGRALAAAHGCFGCHGPEGRGLLRNPGSFKGYIPAWDSDEYLELVRTPEEFHEWVANGEIGRFRENPAAAFYLDRQAIRMPPFRDVLKRDAIESLRAYVEWIRAQPQ